MENLEKVFDTGDTESFWVVLEMYGIEGRLLKSEKNSYTDHMACVKIEEKFCVGFLKDVMMSSW